jgi:hypothetical protein
VLAEPGSLQEQTGTKVSVLTQCLSCPAYLCATCPGLSQRCYTSQKSAISVPAGHPLTPDPIPSRTQSLSEALTPDPIPSRTQSLSEGFGIVSLPVQLGAKRVCYTCYDAIMEVCMRGKNV